MSVCYSLCLLKSVANLQKVARLKPFTLQFVTIPNCRNIKLLLLNHAFSTTFDPLFARFMNPEPLISIITITFNAEGCLRTTLQSVASQTERSFEHLIIDGASTDETLSVARKYGVSGLRIISEPDDGLYYAMNKGLHAARGEYVIFLNAGDAFTASDTLARYARAARNGADMVYADTILVDSDGRTVGPRHLSVPDRLTLRSLAGGMKVCHQAFMVKRSMAPDYDTRYRFSADYDWMVRCVKNSSPDKATNLRCVAIAYLTDGLTDRNMVASLKERFLIMKEHFGLLPTMVRHIGFAGRFLMRRIKNKK